MPRVDMSLLRNMGETAGEPRSSGLPSVRSNHTDYHRNGELR